MPEEPKKKCPRCHWPVIVDRCNGEVFCANANCGYIEGPTANELRTT